MIKYVCILLISVFISSISQIILKKAAMKHYDSFLKEYMNPLVIIAYAVFVLATFLSVIAYKCIPLSLGSVLEATSYVYVTIYGVVIFNEKISARRLCALGFILIGIIVYSLWG